MSLSDSESFFLESGAPDDPIVNGRYRIEGRDYTRATTMAKTLSTEYGVHQWETERAVWGVCQRPDLVAVIGSTDVADRRALKPLVADALVVGKRDAAANEGTAGHQYAVSVLTSKIPLSDVPDRYRPCIAALCVELQRLGLSVVSTEQVITNTIAGAAGRYDLELADAQGFHLIGDLKFGKTDRHGLEFSQQMAIYNHADHWGPEMRRDLAMVFDMSLENGTCFPLDVNTTAGWEYVQISTRVRNGRNRTDLVLPHHDAGGNTRIDSAMQIAPAVEQSRAVVADQIEQNMRATVAAMEQAVPVVAYVPPVLDAEPAPVVNANEGGAAYQPGEVGKEHPDVLALLAQYRSKAEMQEAAKSMSAGIKLAAYRVNMAIEMVSNKEWPNHKRRVLPPAGQIPAPAPSPLDGPKPSLSPQAQQVVDNVAAIREGMIVTPGQPVPAAPVEPAAPNPFQQSATPEDVYLGYISQATKQADIAALWNRAMAEGVAWTDRLNAAGMDKFTTLTS